MKKIRILHFVLACCSTGNADKIKRLFIKLGDESMCSVSEAQCKLFSTKGSVCRWLFVLPEWKLGHMENGADGERTQARIPNKQSCSTIFCTSPDHWTMWLRPISSREHDRTGDLTGNKSCFINLKRHKSCFHQNKLLSSSVCTGSGHPTAFLMDCWWLWIKEKQTSMTRILQLAGTPPFLWQLHGNEKEKLEQRRGKKKSGQDNSSQKHYQTGEVQFSFL